MKDRFVDPIPEEFKPDENEHVVAFAAIRAVRSREMVVNNFLPTFIEKPRNPNSFIEPNKSHYSMSLFRTIEECISAISKYPKLEKEIIGFAEGDTNILKGISLAPNIEGHIDYFLYDYQNNNPCTDFHYLRDK